MSIEYSLVVDGQVLIDNDIPTAYPKGVGVPMYKMEAGRLIEAMNARINRLETELRLLQQPTASVAWSRR